MNIRWLIAGLLFIIYIIITLGCGSWYQWMANDTNGKAFIFREDIRIQHFENAFSNRIKFPDPSIPYKSLPKKVQTKKDLTKEKIMLPSLSVKSLVESNLVSQYPVKNISVKNTLPNSTCHIPNSTILNPIGMNWASFYTSIFIEQGLTHFKIEKFDSILLEFDQFNDYKIKLSLYSDNLSASLSPMDFIRYLINPPEISEVDLILIHEYIIPLSGPEPLSKLRNILWLSDEERILPLFYLNSVLSESMVFLDDSYEVLIKILHGEYKYPFLDFLYFSAVTITTLGYGDILPNHSNVRGVVVGETIFGVFIFGLIVAFVFSALAKPRLVDSPTHKGSQLPS